MLTSLIQDSVQLNSLCQRLRDQPWIALDTEFMRTKTYYARLCLIQVATPEVIACIDPLTLVDIDPLLDLIYAPTVLKVFHSARQDLEVFADLRGAPPLPVFDTQIAGALCGYDDQAGYATLVESITGHKLPKLHTRADWEARPLAAEFLQYAEDDVRYLRDVYRALAHKLETLGRSSWLTEECTALVDPALYRNDPNLAYRRIRSGQTLPAPEQSVLRELATWRERTAQTQNLPRGWVITDAALVDTARAAPENLEQLSGMVEISAAAIRKWGQEILEAVSRGKTAPPQPWEKPLRLDQAQHTLYDRMLTRIRVRAEELGIGPTVLATRKDMQQLFDNEPSGALTRGWRRHIVGEELLQMRAEHNQRAVAARPILST